MPGFESAGSMTESIRLRDESVEMLTATSTS